MKTVRVRYTASFWADLEVPDNVSEDELRDIVNDINIPENEQGQYVSGSFEVDWVKDEEEERLYF